MRRHPRLRSNAVELIHERKVTQKTPTSSARHTWSQSFGRIELDGRVVLPMALDFITPPQRKQSLSAVATFTPINLHRGVFPPLITTGEHPQDNNYQPWVYYLVKYLKVYSV